MHHRISRPLFVRLSTSSLLSCSVQRRLFAVATMWAVAFSSSVNAQIRIVEPETEKNLQAVLDHGYTLEGESRWGEALAHYENALRQTPSDSKLRERKDWAKIHYDLGRRYNDVSFQNSVTSLSEREALDLYSEVLLKIDTHYVSNVEWKKIVMRGTQCVEVAMGDDIFAKRHLQSVPPSRIAESKRRLKRLIDARVITSRQDAVSAVAAASRLISQQTGAPPSALTMEYLSGAAGALDTYSTYLTADQLKEVYSQIDGNFVGLGIELKADEKGLLIVSVITKSPAHSAGILAGDHIVSVDGHSTVGVTTEAAATLLQGPEHSTANLQVITGDQTARNLRVRREHVDVPSVDEVKFVERARGIAYLRIASFQRRTSRDLDTALWKLYHDGMRSLIIDLRGNPGGLLSASVDIADKFVKAGTIVSTRGRNKQEDYDYSAHAATTWRVPLVVLIDGDSASASEIFAAAIHDHDRGTIVGTRSYGKGSVQGIFPLARAGAGIRLTTAKFYSPEGRAISNAGVTPHVTVHQVARTVSNAVASTTPSTDDPALRAAVQAAQKSVAQR